MTKEKWLEKANEYMLTKYHISITDSGHTEDEFYERYGDELPKIAVREFADHYDLIDFGPWA